MAKYVFIRGRLIIINRLLNEVPSFRWEGGFYENSLFRLELTEKLIEISIFGCKTDRWQCINNKTFSFSGPDKHAVLYECYKNFVMKFNKTFE